MSVTTETRGIDKANAEFWNELCGTTMARSLGITDHSLESLKRFDEAYLAFYPYPSCATSILRRGPGSGFSRSGSGTERSVSSSRRRVRGTRAWTSPGGRSR